MENKEIVYLDKIGYEKLLTNIDKIKKELSDLRKTKSDTYKNGVDRIRDNFAFEDYERRERALICRLGEESELLKRVVLIDKQENADVIDINDLVSLTIDFDNNKETNIYKLTSFPDMSIEDGILNVSLNSPLGKAIYLKKVGDDISYVVNNGNFLVHINEKIDEENLKNNHINSR